MEAFLDSCPTLIPGNAVAAILTVDDGRYLMQLRDIKSDIFIPGHWGCFGGAIEPGESELETLSRELQEELGHSIDTAKAAYFTRLHFDFGFAGHGTISRTYFEIRIAVELIPRLVLGEGQDMRLLSLSALLRVRPETLCRITEFSEHESNGRELDEGERVAVEVLPVLGQSAAAVEPGDGAFDHPTPGLDDEALHPIGSLDDLGLEIGQDAGQGAVKDRALIGAVGEQFPEKGKQTEQGRRQRETAVAILNVGGGDDAVQQQALRIDQNMPLLALDQLAGIEAVAVDASPPFSALFTL